MGGRSPPFVEGNRSTPETCRRPSAVGDLETGGPLVSEPPDAGTVRMMKTEAVKIGHGTAYGG